MEYDCHIIDTAGQVRFLLLFVGCIYPVLLIILAFKPFASAVVIPLGRIFTPQFPTRHRNTRLCPCICDNLEEFLRHDSNCLRQDCRLLRCQRHPVRGRRVKGRSTTEVKSLLRHSLVARDGASSWSPYDPDRCSFFLRSRQVDASEGEKLAQANKAAWIETSAKNNVNVGQYI